MVNAKVRIRIIGSKDEIDGIFRPDHVTLASER